ncbi:class I SAM-dependent methyltransferase [Bradyrhizobium sp.]|uniref:class I SAM-dependent methyltransferase n=1 Tax=Bradyrhizobium sp. TaxID=376 RepID=UPI002391647F|nr:methyltransferase domain-containing protein [Bradyrhizobium sp.]
MAAGKASFHLTSADALPFTNDSFDRVFSIDVVHFWTEPLASLSECARASSGRRDGHGMPCPWDALPNDAPDFAQKEFGFHPRDASE